MSDDLTGGCLCGAVRFRATTPALFVVHCHCRWCRAAHGAAFVTWVGVREDGFELTTGEELRWYRSSEQSRRGFCGTCGTTLLYVSDVCPGEVHVARAAIEGEPGLAPTAHVFVDHAVDWVTLGDDLKRVGSDHPGLSKFRVTGSRRP